MLNREAIIEAQRTLLDQGLEGTVKYYVQPRLYSLPQFLDVEHSWLHPSIGGVRSAHAGRLLTMAGTDYIGHQNGSATRLIVL